MSSKIYEKFKKYIKTNYISLIILIVFMILCFIKLPYVVNAPGGAINLNDRVTISNEYNSDGSLSMAYVSMMRTNIPIYLLSYIMPNWDLEKLSSATYESTTLNDTYKIDALYLNESKFNAISSVYKYLDLDLTINHLEYNVISILENNTSNLEMFDKIVAIDGKTFKSESEFTNILYSYEVGQEFELSIVRDNSNLKVKSSLINFNDTKKLGVSIIKNYDYSTKEKIEIYNKSSEVGPSGGLMLALSIYNKLTPDDLTGGLNIIGTGTITENGVVGKIGGIKYKVLGAINNSADLFLCPEENYDEAKSLIEEHKTNMILIKVSTLGQAIEEIKQAVNYLDSK